MVTTLTDGNAFKRIGWSNPDKNMVWLLRFNETDVDRISDEEWKPLQMEIAAFMVLGLLRFKGRGRTPTPEEVQSFADAPFQTRTKAMNKTLASDVQGLSRKAISEFLSRGCVELPRIPGRELVKTPLGPVVEIPQQPFDPGWFFLEEVVGLLVDVGKRLQRCAALDCPRPTFLQKRFNQSFCSNTCRSRVAIREWRKRKHRTKAKKKAVAKGRPKHGE